LEKLNVLGSTQTKVARMGGRVKQLYLFAFCYCLFLFFCKPAPAQSPRAFIPQTPFCARAKTKSLRQRGKFHNPQKKRFSALPKSALKPPLCSARAERRKQNFLFLKRIKKTACAKIKSKENFA